MFSSIKYLRETGQGLVEYALILVLVAVVVIVSLIMFGESLTGAYCSVVNAIADELPEQCDTGSITINSSQYNAAQQRVTIQAQVNGGYDPSIGLVASPGGAFAQQGANNYRIVFDKACPCSITVTASNGDSTTVDLP